MKDFYLNKNFSAILEKISANVCGMLLLLHPFININYAFPKNIFEADTLAVVGRKIITTDDFVNSYKDKITKIGLTDNLEIREKYLLNLVSDEMLIEDAKNKGLDKTGDAKTELMRIETQELLNAYVEKHISPNLNITENDLKDLFVKLNTKIKVSHLYAATKEKADLLYKELKSGKKFENLAKENFADPMLKENGGSLGYITIDEMDPAFEKAAFSMRIGEISLPIKTVYGYSIIKIEDKIGNPLVTESEYLKARDRLKTFARKRAFEEAAASYSHSLNSKLNVKFNRDFVAKLFGIINHKSLQDLIENPLMISRSDLHKTVVSSRLGNWDLQTIINELSIVPEKQKKWIRTQENFEDFISGLINRKYIVNEAIKENLDDEPSFKKNIEFSFGSYLLTTIENKIKEQIKISPDSIKIYYAQNPQYFITEPEMRLSSILIDNSIYVDSVKSYLQNGIPFEELAKRYSVQTVTAGNGGDMGFFKKKDLGELGDKIFSLNIGQWAGPFADETKNVFIKCTDFRKSRMKTLEESSTQIEETLTALRYYSLREEYVQSLKQKINCKIFSQKLNELKL